MQLHKTTDATKGSTLLLNTIVKQLELGKSVLWLLPGGSNIPISVAVMNDIPAEFTERLTLALTDERYGNEGHSDSNWVQLREAGFDNKNATCISVLSNDTSLKEATYDYDEAMQKLLADNEAIIGQFGMGSDGHIAGILPHSPAVTTDSYVTAYETEIFTRITMSFKAITACDTAFLFAFGDDKRQALTNLLRQFDLAEQPAQVLKQIPTSHVYNDQIGDSV